MKKTALVFAAVLVAAPAFADSGAGRTPYGEPASGAGRTLAAWPTPVDPAGPNSGTSRTPYGDPASGAGRNLVANWGTDVINEIGHPNSGASRTPNGDPASGAGRRLA